MLLGCIADDFTGASDLANTLAKGGMATTQFVNVPAHPADPSCEAGVISLKSRTIPASDAIRQSLEALEWLQAQGCRQILFKYCSTFDSTPEGNIGPVAEALLERLGGIAVVCPVFPAAGRTLFNSHLFVNGQLLSETGMRDHPLTPMTDPDIARWLRLQTKGEIGRIPYQTVRQGVAAIRDAMATEERAGRRLVVTDAVVDDDLLVLGEAIADHKLVTGGSGIALGLPANFRKAGLLADLGASSAPSAMSISSPASRGPTAALSGSCSTQSLKQVAHFANGHPVLPLAPGAILDGTMTVDAACNWMMARLDQFPMACSSATAQDVRAAQETFGRDRVAGAVEHFMGALATALVAAGVTRLVVGGGETSGAVVTALDIQAFAIGPEIDPGVPALRVEGKDLHLALKSGNFGTEDFYEKAARALAS